MERDLTRLTKTAIIAAIYVVISITLAALSFGHIQIRFAEALTILPVFNVQNILGITLGCFITNVIGVYVGATQVPDIFVGTLTTLLCAFLTYKLKNIKFNGIPILSAAPPVIVNAVVIGYEIMYFSFNTFWDSTLFLTMSICVFIGQLIACIGFGIPLYVILKNTVYLKRKENVK